jgi:ribonuclease BN (tRNA processing enzyme)
MMKARFWGVRGSIPAAGPDTAYFGGNTSCVQILEDDQPIIILDAGTGIRKLGLDLLANHKQNKEIHLLFSHTHWDHIQGLPFFAPLYVPGYSIKIYGPVHYEKSLEQILAQQMEYTYFPVRVAELAAKISYQGLKEEAFKIGDVNVNCKYLNHPVLCLGYRLEHGGKSIAYCTDHEPYFNLFGDGELGDDEVKNVVEEQNNAFLHFIKDANLLILDTQYTEEEYASHVGWGHSFTTHNFNTVAKSNIDKWALFHHDPDRTDDAEKKIVEDVLQMAKKENVGTEIFAAREGLTVEA